MKITAKQMERLVDVIQVYADARWPSVTPGAITYYGRKGQTPRWFATVSAEMVRISRRGEIRQYWVR